MNNDDRAKFEALPPLPEPRHRGPDGTGAYFDTYTADQMRAYARAALASAQAASAEPVADDAVLVDAVAWRGFIDEYDRYNSGDPKVPFSELRESLAAVIESAHDTTPAPAVAPAVVTDEQIAAAIADGRTETLGRIVRAILASQKEA